jgi:hypothetical protein
MTTLTPLNIIIVEKNGVLKQLSIKDFKENELFKKCGFKKSEDFQQHASWNINFEGALYQVVVYGKTNGRANNENKYEFPPPIDTKLFFGACCIVLKKKSDSNCFTNLSLDKWKKIYDYLFNGFENLDETNNEDEMDVDELKNIPKSKKTKHGGYLKDNFVVDDENSENDDDEEMSISSKSETDPTLDDSSSSIMDDTDDIQDIASELSEEQYLSDN